MVMVTLATASATSFLPSPFSLRGAKCTKLGVGGCAGGTMNLGGFKSNHASPGVMANAEAQAPPKINGTTPLSSSVAEGNVYRQNFYIRSYEIDVHRTASIETLMSYLQETAINYFKIAGLNRDGFGSTPEMCKKDLIWVVTQTQFVAYRYPTWGDAVRVETWISAAGKNAMRSNCLLRDCKTDEVLTRSSSVCVMMNKLTRRLSKFPQEARKEIEAYFVNSALVLEEDNKQIPKIDDNTADYIRTGLSPRWSDLDVNQHVNNVKYIGWILESVPVSILESHEISAMTLKYTRECGKDSKLESLTAVYPSQRGHLECNHLIRQEDGAEVVRGMTEWRPKPVNKFTIAIQVPQEAT